MKANRSILSYLLISFLSAVAVTVAMIGCGGSEGGDGGTGGGDSGTGGGTAASGGTGGPGTGGGTDGGSGGDAGDGGSGAAGATGGSGGEAGGGDGGGGAGTTGGSGGGAGDGGEGGSPPAGSGGDGGGGGGPSPCTGDGEPLPEGECRPNGSGVYAARMLADAHWAGLLGITDSGRDKIVIYLRVDVGDVCDDGTFEAQILPCGARIPTVTSALLCEAFVIDIPDSLWEQPGIEPIAVKGSTTSFAPGGYISLEDTTFVRGIELPDPEGPWPTPAETGSITCPSGEGEACFPDFDLDGHPGLTAYTRPGGNYRDTGCGALGTDPYEAGAAPLSPDATALFGGAARAEEIYVGFRFKGGGGGEIGEDCASGWGRGGLQSLELRAWSCKVLEGTGDFLGEPAGPDQPCNPGQAAFIDENLPAFTPLAEGEVPPQEVLDFLPAGLYPNATEPSEGPISALVRLGDPGADISCEQIRNAEYPGPGL